MSIKIIEHHPYEVLELENGAKLVLTSCPGTNGVSLESSVLQLKQAGTQMLITLMFDVEIQQNNANSLSFFCEQNKITWLQLPIVDDSAPDEIFEVYWQKHLNSILSIIENKGCITIHCKGGYGRTGLVTALILLNYGYSTDKAKQRVQAIRHKALKNKIQLDYFNSYEPQN